VIELWQAVAAIMASCVVVGGGAIAVVSRMLRSDFVTREEQNRLEARMTGVEKHVAGMPSDHDMGNLMQRLGKVETGVAVVQTTVEGVNAGLKRVEHTVGLLLDHQLRKDG
jgi:Protein of unknown function (DUF2730)